MDVFNQDASWLLKFDDPHQVPPESRSRPIDPGAASSHREILAGKPAAHHVGTLQFTAANSPNIVVAPHVGPMLREHRLTERVILNLPPNLEPRTFKPEIEATDATEERSDCERVHLEHPIPSDPRRRGRRPIRIHASDDVRVHRE